MNILNSVLSPEFFYSIFRITTPILFAALAALISTKAGMVNLGLEGSMLISAFCGVIGSAFTQNAFLGLLCAILASVLVHLLVSYFVLKLKTNAVIAGVAINLLASGGTIFFLYILSGDRGISSSLASLTMPNIKIPLIQNIPFLGEVLSNHNLLSYIAFIAVWLMHIFLSKTKIGLRIRAVGVNKNAASSVGVNAERAQYIAMIIAGLLCGLGGAYMSMGYLSWFTKDMVAGRGFIALAAEAMGGGNPFVTMMAALLFGIADTLANILQVLKVPAEFIQMIPYLATIVGLTVYSYRKMHRKNKKIVKEEKA